MKRLLSKEWLAVRLVFASLVIGSVLSVFSTGIQLAASFSRQKIDAVQVLDQIESALADSLQQALWTFDFEQVEIILDGLKSNPSVSFVALDTTTGHHWERGTSTQSELERHYNLQRARPDAPPEPLGLLRIELTVDAIVERVWAEFWTMFTSNLGKAYIGALALLYMVHQLMTRHMRKIVRHVNDPIPIEQKPALALDRSAPLFRDDLDDVVAAITSSEDRTRHTLLSLRTEIRERARAEAEARKALSIRSKFLGTMSHEVRTPLNSIMGLLHLIETNEDVPEKQRHYAEVATLAAHQLLNQLSNALDMSRLETETTPITPARTDMRQLARQWCETARANVHFRQRDVAVTLLLDPRLDDAYQVDGARLTQIVTNLTDNAVKLTSAGEIRISVAPLPLVEVDTGHGLRIAVSDTGPGIAPGDRARIFERFAQLDDSIERRHGGAGLGLAISKELAHRLGARLDVSDAEMDGFATTFLLEIDYNCRLEPENENAQESIAG